MSILMAVRTVMHLEKSPEPDKNAFCEGILLHTVAVADETSFYSSVKNNPKFKEKSVG